MKHTTIKKGGTNLAKDFRATIKLLPLRITALKLLGERLFSGANLVALGFCGLYYGIYQLLIKMIANQDWIIFGIITKLKNEDLYALLGPSDYGLIEWVGEMAWFGLLIVGISFVVAQLVNYKKKNFSMTSFIIMLCVFALIGLPYVIQLMKLGS